MLDRTLETERHLTEQRRYWTDLIDEDDGTPALFDSLARRSAPHIPPFLQPRWDAGSAFTPCSDMPTAWKEQIPPGLVAEWDAYAARWHRFVGRNPLVGVALMLSDISETHDGSSFPIGRETDIRLWIGGGFQEPTPFDDKGDITSSEWRRKIFDAMVMISPLWVRHEEGRLIRYRPGGPSQ